MVMSILTQSLFYPSFLQFNESSCPNLSLHLIQYIVAGQRHPIHIRVTTVTSVTYNPIGNVDAHCCVIQKIIVHTKTSVRLKPCLLHFLHTSSFFQSSIFFLVRCTFEFCSISSLLINLCVCETAVFFPYFHGFDSKQ